MKRMLIATVAALAWTATALAQSFPTASLGHTVAVIHSTKLKELESKVEAAKSEAEMRQERAEWSRRMVAKGWMTESSLEAERIKLAKAQGDLEKAQQDLHRLRRPK